jgi:23S rRNA pseudouridine2605 synthase
LARNNGVPLNRAMSKLGILSRRQATDAIRAGRVRVNGRVVLDPSTHIVPETARIEVDGVTGGTQRWRTVLLHKPRGVVTSRRDPQGRKTVFDLLGDTARGLISVGRLDMATSGVLLLTTDTRLADRITDPNRAVPRFYVVTVRGLVNDAGVEQLRRGIGTSDEAIRAASVALRKASSRESHLVVELREGKNREVRRLFAAIGHDVTRLKRVRFGNLELGSLQPGEWRELDRDEVVKGFSPWLPVRAAARTGNRQISRAAYRGRGRSQRP